VQVRRRCSAPGASANVARMRSSSVLDTAGNDGGVLSYGAGGSARGRRRPARSGRAVTGDCESLQGESQSSSRALCLGAGIGRLGLPSTDFGLPTADRGALRTSGVREGGPKACGSRCEDRPHEFLRSWVEPNVLSLRTRES
jgi:hypothetical protein